MVYKSCKVSICQPLLMLTWRLQFQLPAPGLRSSSDVWSRPLSFRIVEPHSFHRATALSHNSYHYNNRPVAMNGIYILPCQIILLDEHWVRAIPTYLKLPLCDLRDGILKTQNVSNPWYCITPPLNCSNSKTDNQVLQFRRKVR